MSVIRGIRDVLARAAVLGAVGLGSLASALIINVPGDQPTIVAAVNAAGSGDEIVVQPGIYTESAGLVFNQPNVTLRAASGTVTLRGPASEASLVYINASNVTLRNISVERPTANNDWMRCVEMGGSANFVQCNFQGNANGVGVILFNTADASFTSCTFQSFNSTANWAAAISLEGNAGSDFTDLTVEGCQFLAGCNKWIASVNPGAPPRVGTLTVRNSTFAASNASQPIFLHFDTRYSNTRALLFEGNSFTGNINEITELHYTNFGGPQSVTFRQCVYEAYNSNRRLMFLDIPAPITFENVLVKGGQFQTLLRVWGGPPSVNFYHCTFITDGVDAAQGAGGTAGSTFIDGWDGGRTFVVRNCIFHTTANFTPGFIGDSGSSANRNYDVAYSIISHPTPTGSFAQITSGTNYFNTAPIFVSAGSRDYNLASGSVGLGQGTDLGYTTDALGGARPLPNGSIPDIGALESILVPVELSNFELN